MISPVSPDYHQGIQGRHQEDYSRVSNVFAIAFYSALVEDPNL